MLQVHQLTKFYGPQIILDEISFVLSRGDRVGLVGPNGCGKSTLLRIIAGLEKADQGEINLDSHATLGYLPQGTESPLGRSVLVEIQAGLPSLMEAQQQVNELTKQMSQARDEPLDKLLAAYGQAQAQFETLGGYEVEYRILEILADLGLADLDLTAPLQHLSGGQRARVGLARLLLAQPTLLLLDEPTNHLDLATLSWLEQFIASYDGAVLLVSHDRMFLDQTVSRILALELSTHHLTDYTGNYSDYHAAKALWQEKQWTAWKDQQAEIRRVEADIRRTHGQAQHNEQATTDSSMRRYAKKVAKKAKAREGKLRRFLEAEERVEKPQQSWGLKFDFGEMPRGGQIVLTLKDIGHTYDPLAEQALSQNGLSPAPPKPWLFHSLNITLQHGERIALLGPNGAGKTTLLRLIAADLNPTVGQVRLGANVRLGYMPQQQESLPPRETPLALIRQIAPVSETEARSFLHFFLFAHDEVFRPISSLSYGERARLLLARMVISGTNFLLLDEPVNHLDIPARERFEQALDVFPGTILAATHDRAFIDRFATSVWALENQGIQPYFSRAEMLG